VTIAQDRPRLPGAFFLRQYPLTFYFLIALGISWAVVAAIVALGLSPSAAGIAAITAGPALSSLIMTGICEGAEGVRRLLGRLVLWGVPFAWYLFALLGIPAVYVLGTAFLPGALSSFDPLTPEKWLSYLWLFPLVIVVGGPLLEEIGWRGFALPRLEAKYGPLIGTLVLGLLWAAWHYPQYLMPEWAAQNGGFNVKAVTIFTIAVVPIALLLSWVFNNTRGSLLLAILAHASINTFSVFIDQIFPAQAGSQVGGMIGFGVAALLIVVLTKGRLGYDRYLRETENEVAPDTRA
jgi:membrane protease YdiL (CAAX protease family)